MMMSSELPSASSSVKPNMRSARGIQRVIAPFASEMTMASPIASTSCSKSMVFCRESGLFGGTCSSSLAYTGTLHRAARSSKP